MKSITAFAPSKTSGVSSIHMAAGSLSKPAVLLDKAPLPFLPYLDGLPLIPPLALVLTVLLTRKVVSVLLVVCILQVARAPAVP